GGVVAVFIRHGAISVDWTNVLTPALLCYVRAKLMRDKLHSVCRTPSPRCARNRCGASSDRTRPVWAERAASTEEGHRFNQWSRSGILCSLGSPAPRPYSRRADVLADLRTHTERGVLRASATNHILKAGFR